LGLFCAKELWFFDVFAPDWARGANSKFKMQNAKLRNAEVVGMAVFTAGGRQKADLGGQGLGSGQGGADCVLGIGFELGLFFWGWGAVVFV